MAKNLFIAGLSYSTTSDGLEKHFSEIGKVTSAQVIMDKFTGQSKGFGFVEMSTDDEAKLALDKLNGTTLDGRSIVVKEARPRTDYSRDNSFGNNGQRGNQRRDQRGSRRNY